jgi:periplasmic protein TonB
MHGLTRSVISISLAASAFSVAAVPAQAATVSITPLSATPTVAVGEGCTARDHAAAIAGVPFFEMPEIARLQRVTGESLVRIDLTASGALRSAALASSSGNRWLDGAALATARISRYVPEVRNCTPIAGAYLISVQFGPDDLG